MQLHFAGEVIQRTNLDPSSLWHLLSQLWELLAQRPKLSPKRPRGANETQRFGLNVSKSSKASPESQVKGTLLGISIYINHCEWILNRLRMYCKCNEIHGQLLEENLKAEDARVKRLETFRTFPPFQRHPPVPWQFGEATPGGG